jgi:hypothetical protein
MDRTTGKSLVSSSDLIRSKSPSFSPNKPCRRCTSDHSLSTSGLSLGLRRRRAQPRRPGARRLTPGGRRGGV